MTLRSSRVLGGAAALLVGLRCAPDALAQTTRVIGLLNLPAIVGDGCGAPGAFPISLYDGRSTSRPPVAAIRMAGDSQHGCSLVVRRTGESADRELPSLESDYEIPAAIVYERSAPWFRIALPNGSAWLLHAREADFLPYPNLLTNRLAYVRAGWDEVLRDSPDSPRGIQTLTAAWKTYSAKDVPVDVLGSRRVRGVLWLHVRLRDETCGDALEGVEPLTGWVPAYRLSGDTSVWFYSRGC